MYILYVEFTCHPDKREAFVERVKSEGILSQIRAEDGCLLYDYYFSEGNPRELLLVERWTSEEHQQIHINQPHMDRMREFKDEYVADTRLRSLEII